MEIYYKDEQKKGDSKKFTAWLSYAYEEDSNCSLRAMAMNYKPGTQRYAPTVNHFDNEAVKVEISDLVFDQDLRQKLKKVSELLVEASPKYRPKMIMRAKKLIEIIDELEK